MTARFASQRRLKGTARTLFTTADAWDELLEARSTSAGGRLGRVCFTGPTSAS